MAEFIKGNSTTTVEGEVVEVRFTPHSWGMNLLVDDGAGSPGDPYPELAVDDLGKLWVGGRPVTFPEFLAWVHDKDRPWVRHVRAVSCYVCTVRCEFFPAKP